MDWYYLTGNEKQGPLTDEQFQQLVRDGTVNAFTLIWHDGMDQWAQYRSAEPAPADHAACGQCGRYFSRDDLLDFNGTMVCAECKPLFLQRQREGVAPLPGVDMTALHFAGFWRRFAAHFLDAILLYIANMAVSLAIIALFGPVARPGRYGPAGLAGLPFALLMIATYGVPIAYETYMIGRFGSTLGKMALGVRIIVADGTRVSYWRAFGRYFAKIVSALILLIGFIMAGFDSEKRALHDMICNTRAIRR